MKSFLFPQRNRIILSVLLLGLLASCSKKTDLLTQVVSGIDFLTTKPTAIVQAGSSIQAAVDAANPGAVIKIEPGVYSEAIIVNKPNITLMGSDESGGVIIENPGGVNNGITVRSDGDGFKLYNVTVRNFLENGVITIRADNFVISHVTATNCGEYGFWPIRSNNGLIEHCTASGHTDSGIYTGQSENIELKFNTVFDNTIGLEIENCTNVIATNNHCYGNVAGILVVLLPGLQTTVTTGIDVSNNHVRDNNKVNNVDPANGFEAFVPSGCGILVVGADNTVVNGNKVQNNNFLGIAVVSSLVLGGLAGIPPAAFAGIEPNPDGVKVTNNVANSNGKVQPPLPFPAVDLLWDGSGTGNCWSSNNYVSAFPQALPSCP